MRTWNPQQDSSQGIHPFSSLKQLISRRGSTLLLKELNSDVYKKDLHKPWHCGTPAAHVAREWWPGLYLVSPNLRLPKRSQVGSLPGHIPQKQTLCRSLRLHGTRKSQQGTCWVWMRRDRRGEPTTERPSPPEAGSPVSQPGCLLLCMGLGPASFRHTSFLCTHPSAHEPQKAVFASAGFPLRAQWHEKAQALSSHSSLCALGALPILLHLTVTAWVRWLDPSRPI